MKKLLNLLTDKTFGIKYNQVVKGKPIGDDMYLITLKRQRFIIFPSGEIESVINKEKVITHVVKENDSVVYLEIQGE